LSAGHKNRKELQMKKNIFVLGMLVMTLTLGFVFIGCDNGNNDPDITAPTLSLQVVAVYEKTQYGTTATVVFYSNEAGSYYVQVLDSATAAPNASALAGSSFTGTVTANTATMVNITGLTKNSAHKAYVTVKDAAGNYSAVWSSDSFTPTQASVVNPITGTRTYTGNGTFQGFPFTAVCEVTGNDNNGTFKTTVTVAGQGYGAPPPFIVTQGTYVYNGNPVIWTVTYANSQYTTLKVGDVGIAKIEESGDIFVFNFIDPVANGTYTEQP
jgi:hypothetical protein